MLLRRSLKLVLPPERFIEITGRRRTLLQQTMGEHGGPFP
jgi:hypothetical protein